MSKIAFLTYNGLGRDGAISNGWHHSDQKSALVLQNTNEGQRGSRNIGSSRRREEIDTLWSQLERELPTLDRVYIYIGARGSERAIELARQMSPQKVTFVSCDCGLDIKAELVLAAGLGQAKRIICECGGWHTMRELYDEFMGSAPAQAA